jgi:hypothetical protein
MMTAATILGYAALGYLLMSSAFTAGFVFCVLFCVGSERS